MPSPAQQTVLVVDDDEVVRDSLQARNSAVSDFTPGQDFLDRRNGVRGDCLLLDIHMPGMSGLDPIKHLRARGDRIPVVMITGRNDPSIQAQAKKFGASALLEKPITSARLFAAPDEAIASARH